MAHRSQTAKAIDHAMSASDHEHTRSWRSEALCAGPGGPPGPHRDYRRRIDDRLGAAGMANVIIAMLIASIKASLVALFFMHLRWDKPMTGIIFCSTLFFLGLFLIGCYTDQVARPWPEPTNLKPPVVKPGAGATTPGAPPPVGTAPAPAAPVLRLRLPISAKIRGK